MAVELTAYAYGNPAGWVIEPSRLQRDWMDQTLLKSAYRCLPLAMANQAGWVIRSPVTFKARWTARKNEPESLEVTFQSREDDRFKNVIRSNFGLGIITIVMPWLFRTSKGYGLWVHGPSNSPRSDVVALEGLVETDWSPAPFTMNWKIIRPKVDVWFKKGDAVCTITPYPLELLEDVTPKLELLEANPEMEANYRKAAAKRIEAHRSGEAAQGKFELNYMRGERVDGEKAEVHRTNLKLADFQATQDYQERHGAPTVSPPGS